MRRRPALLQGPEPASACSSRARGGARRAPSPRPTSAVAAAAKALAGTRRRARSACSSRRSRRSRTCSPPRTVAKEALGVAEVYVGGRPDGWQDDFLKRADENPNRKGLELVAQALGLAVRPFAELGAAVAAGKVRGLWAVGAELPDAAAARSSPGLEDLVVQATNDGPLAHDATVLLPAAPHSEMDGTFVNFEGRAQRFELAYFPRGEARPHWALAAEIGEALGLGHRFASGRDVFAALGPKLGGALGDFRWDGLPSTGKRFGIFPLAAGTVDGRLAGNRDRAPRRDERGLPARVTRTS